jgi:hypothetical protein
VASTSLFHALVPRGEVTNPDSRDVRTLSLFSLLFTYEPYAGSFNTAELKRLRLRNKYVKSALYETEYYLGARGVLVCGAIQVL